MEDTRYPLTGLEPGDYRFKIIEADPFDPDKAGGESGEIRLKLEAGPEVNPSGMSLPAVPAVSATVAEDPVFEPAPAAIPQGAVRESVPAMPPDSGAPPLNGGDVEPLPVPPANP